MEWLINNFSTALVVIGLALLVIEIAVLGFSVFILFFVGLACIVTGLLTFMGILPHTLIAAFGSVAILSLLFAVGLWKPLQKMQNSGAAQEVKADFIGQSFQLQHDISPLVYSSYRMSGVDWKVKSDTPLAAGTLVEVVKTEVGMLTVAAKP